MSSRAPRAKGGAGPSHPLQPADPRIKARPEDLVAGPRSARLLGRRFPCSIGKGGISASKREGDGRSPAGAHRISGILYRPDRIPRGALPAWAKPLRLDHVWSDDPADPNYNSLLRGRPYPLSHERLWRPDPLYDIILLTGYNLDRPEPGLGSAIFIHTWRGPGHPTAGCLGLARRDLLWVARKLKRRSRIIFAGG